MSRADLSSFVAADQAAARGGRGGGGGGGPGGAMHGMDDAGKPLILQANAHFLCLIVYTLLSHHTTLHTIIRQSEITRLR